MARGGKRKNAGRPRTSARTTRVWVRVRPELLAEVKRLAALQGRDPGKLLSVFIETGMMVWSEETAGVIDLIVD